MELESAKAGERRLRACKLLGWPQIEVRMMDTRDAEHELNIEISENDVRKGFTKTERVDYIKRLLRIEQAKAKERMAAGGEGREISHTLRSDESTAEQFGISSNTMRRELFIADNADLLDPADFADWDQRIGKILRELPTGHGNRFSDTSETLKADALKEAGIARSQAYDLQAMAANPDVVQAVLDKAEAEGRIPSRKQVRFLANSGTGCE